MSAGYTNREGEKTSGEIYRESRLDERRWREETDNIDSLTILAVFLAIFFLFFFVIYKYFGSSKESYFAQGRKFEIDLVLNVVSRFYFDV